MRDLLGVAAGGITEFRVEPSPLAEGTAMKAWLEKWMVENLDERTARFGCGDELDGHAYAEGTPRIALSQGVVDLGVRRPPSPCNGPLPSRLRQSNYNESMDLVSYLKSFAIFTLGETYAVFVTMILNIRVIDKDH